MNPPAATILLVEDDTAVRELVGRILEGGGFRILPASSAAQAMLVEAGFHGPIHLLLSDIVMPGMTGPDLASALKERRPDMRVMLMSGYPDGALLLLNYGWHFIAKPFMPQVLLGKVRDILASAEQAQGTDQFDTRKSAAAPVEEKVN
jgi:DNA-binding NtrC family response regulator